MRSYTHRTQEFVNSEEKKKLSPYAEWPLCDFCGSNEYTVKRATTFSDASFSSSKSQSFMYASSDSSMGAVVECLTCTLRYQSPRDKDVSQIYEGVGDDEFYSASKDDRIATCKRDANQLERTIGPLSGKKLLDVGCSYGLFLDVAKERGMSTYGIELSRYQSSVAKKRHLQICTQELPKCGFPEAYFDVMTLFDVIEHLPSPQSFMKEAFRFIRPDGFLVLCTPNCRSMEAKLFGTYWLNFARMHFYYFSPKTITVMLKAAGFEVVRIEKHKRIIKPINVIGWMKKHPRIYPIFKALFAHTPLGKIQWTSGLSGNMVVYARKKVD